MVDAISLELITGSKVDYSTELIGSQFKIIDNPAASSNCGCVFVSDDRLMTDVDQVLIWISVNRRLMARHRGHRGSVSLANTNYAIFCLSPCPKLSKL